MTTELATAYISLVPSAKGIAAGIATEIGAPLEAAALSSGAAASGAFSNSFGSGLGGLSGLIGKALPVAAVAGIAGGLLKLGTNFHDSFATIRVDTGATGAALNGLEDDFKRVLSIRPDSMDNVALAVSKLNVGLKLSGQPLQDMAAQVLRLSSLTKTDLGTNLDSVTQLMNNFSIATDQQGGKLDELFRASQATGVSVSDLASSMASGGSVLRTVGLDFEQSAALLGLLGKVGVDTGSIMQPLSHAIKEAATQGKDASQVLGDVFTAIRNAPNDTAAAGAAIDVFGARAGPRLAGLIRQGKLSYQDLANTIATGTDTIAAAANDTAKFSTKFAIFKNQLAVAFEPLAIKTVDAATQAMVDLGPHLTDFANFISGATTAVTKLFDTNPAASFTVLATVLGTLLLPAVSAIGGALLGLLSPAAIVFGGIAIGAVLAYTHIAAFRDLVAAALVGLQTVTEAVTFSVQGFFSAFNGEGVTSDGVVGFAERIGVALRGAFDRVAAVDWSGLLGGIKTKVEELGQAFKDHQNDVLPLLAGLGAFAVTIAGLNKATNAANAASSAVKSLGPVLSSALTPLLAAGPVGLIIAAVVAIGAAFVVAYLKIKPFHDAVDRIASTVRDLAGSAFADLKVGLAAISGAFDTVTATLSGIGSSIADGFTAGQDAIAPFVQWFNDNVVSTIVAGVDLLSIVLIRAFNVIELFTRPGRAFIEDVLRLLVAELGPVAGIVGAVLEAIGHDITGFVNTVLPLFLGAWDVVVFVVKTAFGAVQFVITTTLDIIRGLFEVFSGILHGDWSKVWDGLQDIVVAPMNAAKDFVSGIFDDFVGLVSGLPSRFALAAIGLWGWITEGLHDAARIGLAVLNALIAGLDQFSIHISSPGLSIAGHDVIPDWSYDWNGLQIPPVKIDGLADGGIAVAPALRMFGEAGPEAVLPLDRLPGMMAASLRAAFASAPAATRADSGIHIDNVTLVGNDVREALHELPGELSVAAFLGGS